VNRPWFACAVGAIASVASPTTAQQPVVFSVDPCVAATLPPDQLLRALRAELGEAQFGALVESSTTASDDTTVIELSCDSGGVLVTTVGSDTRRSPPRRLDVTSLSPAVAARTVALILAELVRLERATPPAPPPPPPPPTAATPIPPAVEAPLTPAETQEATGAPFRVGLAMSYRMFPSGGSGLFGVRAQCSFGRDLVLRVEAEFAGGAASDALGDVSLSVFGGALEGLWVHRGTDVGVGVGPRIEVDYALAHAESSRSNVDASDDDAAIASIGAAFLLSARLQERWDAVLGIDIGWTVAGFRVQSSAGRILGLSGPSLGVALGVALDL